MTLLIYLVLGIVAWAAWPNLATEGRLAYVAIFPIHAAILWYLTRLFTCRESFLNNGWFWWPVGIFLGVITLCTGC